MYVRWSINIFFARQGSLRLITSVPALLCCLRLLTWLARTINTIYLQCSSSVFLSAYTQGQSTRFVTHFAVIFGCFQYLSCPPFLFLQVSKTPLVQCPNFSAAAFPSLCVLGVLCPPHPWVIFPVNLSYTPISSFHSTPLWCVNYFSFSKRRNIPGNEPKIALGAYRVHEVSFLGIRAYK